MTQLPTTRLDEINSDLFASSYLPGWADRPGGPSMWPEPRTHLQAAQWRFGEARQALTNSASLLGMEDTERRNVILVNPSEQSVYGTGQTHVVAYQMILPGEHARTHRHSPHAGRLILDADAGAYTIVNGMRIDMAPGDVVLTPSWHWHGHGHDGDEAAFWIDFLDVPLVQLLEPMFFEPYDEGFQDASADGGNPSSLVFPWSETVRRLDAMDDDTQGIYGRRVRLGEPALPTIGLAMQRLPEGRATVPIRSSANLQYCVVEGDGCTVIEDQRLEWARGDVIAVPSWQKHHHEATGRATLFEISDEPLQRYCGYFRLKVVA